MLEIGTRFRYDWGNDDYEEEDSDEVVTVHGYVYYDGFLYYTCVGDSGVEVDVYYLSAQRYAKEYKDEN